MVSNQTHKKLKQSTQRIAELSGCCNLLVQVKFIPNMSQKAAALHQLIHNDFDVQMQVQKVWVLSFYRMTALWCGGLKSPNSEPAKLRTDRERDAGYSLWLRILETDHKPLETILKKPIIKHPSICKRDPLNEALCSQRQIHIRQSTYSRRYALQSLLTY